MGDFGAQGRTWQQLPVGTTFTTSRRTVTEHDLMTMITLAGITEPLFMDARHSVAAGYEGRLVPGVLTYCLAEGLVVQTGVFHGTGVAFLGAELKQVAPVYVGDTIHVEVEVTGSRASSKGDRGVVTSLVTVHSDRHGRVMTYTPARLVRGSAPGHGGEPGGA
jgi:acyl dehydratase